MKNLITKIQKWAFLAATFPFVYGCVPPADGSSSLASLPGVGAGTDFGAGAGGAEQLATLHNPEPVSLLLLGGGFVAATYLTRRKK